MPSTCSPRYSDSRKSQRCPSPLSPATLCKSSRLHGFKWSSPFHGGRLGDVLEDNSSATLGLVFHQLHAMGALLARLRLEVSSESMEGLVVPVEVRTHGKIDVRGIEFHVDLLVDQ